MEGGSHGFGMPVTEKEWLDARLNCKVGDTIRVFNHWREEGKGKQGKEGRGRWEKSRIKKIMGAREVFEKRNDWGNGQGVF